MKYEQYKRMIEQTHEDHKKGNLNEIEYIVAYNEILDVVADSSELTDEERRQLVTEIRVRIGQVPKVEETRKREEGLQREQAFLEAKDRFKKLSVFSRIKLNFLGQNPEQVIKRMTDVEAINGLYRK